MRQHDSRTTIGVVHCLMISRIDLEGIMTTAVEAPDVLVGQILDHLGGLEVLAEERLASISPSVGLVVLIIAIDSLIHPLLQDTILVLFDQWIPQPAPDHLDHVPAGT